MKQVKCVAIHERESNRTGLKKIGENSVRLEEICGEIGFCETKPTGYGSNLIIHLVNCAKKIWWQYQSKMPMPAIVGQCLRGFYEQVSDGDIIALEAYELLDSKGEVLIRCANKGRFIEK